MSSGGTVPQVRVCLLIAVWFGLSTGASAQYFGANKVRYESFDFKVLETERFDIYHYEKEEEAVRDAARMAERWYTRLSAVLDHQLSSRQPLILYASHPHFQQTNVVQGMIGEGTGGLTEALRRRIVLPFGASAADTDHVIGHELVHAFQFDIAANTRTRGLHLPLWFVEGMAEYLSIGPFDPHTAMWLRDAMLNENLPRISELVRPEFFPYRYGHALWSYLAGRWGDRIVGDAYRLAVSGDPIDTLERLTGIEEEELSNQWHAAIREAYGGIVQARRPPLEAGRPLYPDQDEDEITVAPALSPDGSRLMFLSSRSRLSIDLYLAETDTGRIIRRLSRSATNPHLDSLQFVNASGSWDGEGKRFAYSSIQRGQPHITVVDVESGDTVEEVRLEALGEIFHPALSPDGKVVAFSAIQGGVTDLYLYEFESDTLTRVTRDLLSDQQPDWSPDGRRIAFATERFSSDPKTLTFGPLKLAIMDVATREIRPVPLPEAFRDAKQMNPQWGPDGRTLYFIGAPQGISDVFRLDLESGQVVPITRLATGATGITNNSPALSVAAKSGRVAFSVLWRNAYQVVLLDDAVPVELPAHTRAEAATLPPVRRDDGELARLLENRTAGLPPPQQFPVHPYRANLGLEFVGQPSVGVGTDAFGTYFGGGVSFLWSDLLGDHLLGATAQIQGDIRDFSGQLAYLNRENRLGWGGIAEQISYRSGFVTQRLDSIDGRPAVVDEITQFRQYYRQVGGILEYPFSRAQRVEFSGGLRSIGVSAEQISQAFDLATGQFIGEAREDIPGLDTVNMAEASAALVFDTGIFGPTSPLLGRRYRLEATQTAGGLTFTSLLADFRQYLMPLRPLTLAGRGVVLGRLGGDIDDPRLTPLFLGYPTLVRGYEWDSFRISECRPSSESTCPEIDRLFGDGIAVLNAELRFPLVGIFTGELEYGPIPVEGLVFFDAGIAWSGDRNPSFGDDWIRSTGAGVRVNALGFAVLEFAAVRPLDRDRGWLFSFGIRPGF